MLCNPGNEFCERLAFYGLATNLVTYVTQVMGGDPATAAIQVGQPIVVHDRALNDWTLLALPTL